MRHGLGCRLASAEKVEDGPGCQVEKMYAVVMRIKDENLIVETMTQKSGSDLGKTQLTLRKKWRWPAMPAMKILALSVNATNAA